MADTLVEMSVFSRVVAAGSLSVRSPRIGPFAGRSQPPPGRPGVPARRAAHQPDHPQPAPHRRGRRLPRDLQPDPVGGRGSRRRRRRRSRRAAGHPARRPARLVRQPARRAADPGLRGAPPEGQAGAQPLRPLRQRDRGRLRPRGAHRRAGGFLARGAQARAQPSRGVREPGVPAPPRHAAQAAGAHAAQLPHHRLRADR